MPLCRLYMFDPKVFHVFRLYDSHVVPYVDSWSNNAP